MPISIHSLRTLTHTNSKERDTSCPNVVKDDYLMQHTKAILLMDKYEIKDYTSQSLVVSMAILVCLLMVLVMVEHSSVQPDSPFFVTPNERWNRLLPLNSTDQQNNELVINDY